MCGIIGIVIPEKSNIKVNTTKSLINELFLLSESRGKDASGMAIRSDDNFIVYKCPISPSTFIKDKKYEDLLQFFLSCKKKGLESSNSLAFLGHVRLVTNGKKENNNNNQPISLENVVCVHNGIVVNDKELEQKYPELKRNTDLDSEIIAKSIEDKICNGKTIPGAISKTFQIIRGEASIGTLYADYNVLSLSTNTGSIYYLHTKDIFVAASERFILSQLCKNNKFSFFLDEKLIFQLKPCKSCILDIKTLDFSIIDMCSKDRSNEIKLDLLVQTKKVPIDDQSNNKCKINPEKSSMNIGNKERISKMISDHYNSGKTLKRCTKCILPYTFPYIEFDKDGVCNYCRNYSPIKLKGEAELKNLVAQYIDKASDHDCIIGFSGGRDSSYALHYIQKYLDLNPIAYTFDWGMVTDLARRNCARMCEGLQVEHIIVSADLEKKWRNVRKNLHAWLNKPDLGMVPILMAGDKQFYYFAHKLKNDTGISLVLGGANPYEKTDFKLGFCGISPEDTRGKGLLTGIRLHSKIKLFLYYFKQYLVNPAYINGSIIDTLHAFYSTYILKDTYLNVYDYIPWDENDVVSLLRGTYDWEVASDTKTTWRIGDGTAAFYNYIYYTIAGFSEIDTFRSNQVREGVITREKAISLAEEENKPRIDSLQWYAETIGFNLEDALGIIHNIPTLYDNSRRN